MRAATMTLVTALVSGLAGVASSAETVPNEALQKLPLISPVDGRVEIDCSGKEAVAEYTKRKAKNGGWEAIAEHASAIAEVNKCMFDGQVEYTKVIESKYNDAAKLFNTATETIAAMNPLGDQVNAAIKDVEAAYTACDAAVPQPDETGVCLKKKRPSGDVPGATLRDSTRSRSSANGGTYSEPSAWA